jgi:serine/threonine-protein kinase
VVGGIPPDLDRVVVHATEKDRERRPASASALAESVAAAAASLPAATPVGTLAAQIPAAEFVPDERAPTVTIPRALSARARRRRRLRRVALVLTTMAMLAVAAGATWVYAVPHYTHVPNVESLSVRDASARLKGAGLTVVFGDPVFSTTVPAGVVIRTLPPPGTKVRKGSTVTVIESSGPELLAIPDVHGLTEDRARSRLGADGFKVTVASAFDETAPEGRVIDQSPSAGTKLERGSPVTITVSLGPPPVTIPDVSGQAATEAEATLSDLGLKVKRKGEFSVQVPEGDVIRTEPPIGTELPKGSKVSVVVSKGPKTFAMPSVLGLTADQATTQLKNLGLVVHLVQVPGSIGNTVVGQDPPAGQVVREGADVTIYVGG